MHFWAFSPTFGAFSPSQGSECPYDLPGPSCFRAPALTPRRAQRGSRKSAKRAPVPGRLQR
eukprot:713807-Alexandrium_andersonii.AAC.1